MQVLQTVEQIRKPSNLSEELKRLLETCPLNPNPYKQCHRIRIICPKCNEPGTLNHRYHYDKEHPTIEYEIAHYIHNKSNRNHRYYRNRKRCYYANLKNTDKYFRDICDQLFPISND